MYLLAHALFRRVIFVLALVAEPICHLLGIPHPEGMGAQCANLLATLPADEPGAVAQPVLPHEPVFTHAQDEPAPEPQEGLIVNTYMFNLHRQVRKALNYALAKHLRDLGKPTSGDTWAIARRSIIAIVIGRPEDEAREFIGAWDTLDEAHDALIGLDEEDRYGVLMCMRVILPTSQEHLDEIIATYTCEDDDEPTHADVTRLAGLLESIHAGGLGESALADEVHTSLSDALARLAPVFRVEPVIARTQPMTATERVRAERKAAGLTARGTVPQPPCGAPTRSGGSCKRKANTGSLRCDWHYNVPVSAYTEPLA